MPGILKTHGFETLNFLYRQTESNIANLTLPRIASSVHNMDRKISYVPPQVDLLLSASTRAVRWSPMRLLLQDAAVLSKMLPYFPWMFLPRKTSDDKAELYLSRQNAKEMTLQVLLFLYELALLLLFIPGFFVLPGSVSMIFAGGSVLIVRLIAWPMEGSGISQSSMDEAIQVSAQHHTDERWLFINGCASGQAGLQSNIDCISQIFGRAVIGIHNSTYGVVADLIGCLIQRVFAYNTTDVRVAYEQIKAVLCDPTVSKVVLIGHSQGGIVISLVLDYLFDELPSSTMSKLEIYTFGSAASHFCNPRLSLDHDSSDREQGHVISHIEHYANEYDMVPRWGVLHSTHNILSNRYAGSVFVRMGASGHMFNQHYMDAMFRYLEPERQKMDDRHWLVDPFLDKVVTVDEQVVNRRESLAAEQLSVIRRESGLQFGNGETLPDTGNAAVNGSKRGSDPVMTFVRTDSGRLLSEEARGKTVRELSRLWRYQGGRSPDAVTVNGYSDA